MDSDKTHKIVADWYAAIGAGDFPAIMDPLADDVVLVLGPKPHTEIVPYLRTWVGKSGFADAVTTRDSYARVTGFDLRDLVAEGNRAVALSHTKTICLATGKEFELDVVQWMQLNDDAKIVNITAYFDPVPEIDAFTPDA